jgi:ATP-dependent protease ClpP protease subunit
VGEVIRLYDEIGGWGVTAGEFAGVLAQVGGDVDLFINSPGGDLWDGLAMYAALCRHPGQVRVTVDGLAASAASVVAMAASAGQLVMTAGSLLMIHEANAVCAGSSADMIAMAGVLDKASDSIAGVYAARAGRDAASWRAAMAAETWYTPAEAVAAGLADSVLAAAAA